MKLKPATNLGRTNKATSKKLSIASCRQILMSLSFFPIYGKLGAIWQPNSKHMVCNYYIVVNINTFYLTKTENRTKNSLKQFPNCRIK